MTSIVGLRLIEPATTTVALVGVTTDSYAGTLCIAYRTSGPYGPGDEAEIIANAVGVFVGPNYGEHTVAVTGLTAGSTVHFGACQQYGEADAVLDYTFEPTRDVDPAWIFEGPARIVPYQGVLTAYAANSPAYTDDGLALSAEREQFLTNREDFSTWAAVGCTLAADPSRTPMPGRSSFLLTDAGDDTTGEVSIAHGDFSVPSTLETTGYCGWSIYCRVVPKFDTELNEITQYIRLDITGAHTYNATFSAYQGDCAVSATSGELKNAEYSPVGNGWWKLSVGLDMTTNDTTNFKVSLVSDANATTILRDGTNKLSVFGVNMQACWHYDPGIDYIDTVAKLDPALLKISDNGVNKDVDFSWYSECRLYKPSDYQDGSTSPEESRQTVRFGSRLSDYTKSVFITPNGPGTLMYLVLNNDGDHYNSIPYRFPRNWRQIFFGEARPNEVKLRLNQFAPQVEVIGEVLNETYGHIILNQRLSGNREFYSDYSCKRLAMWAYAKSDEQWAELVPENMIIEGDYGTKWLEIGAFSADNRLIDATKAIFRPAQSTHLDVNNTRQCAWEGGGIPVLRYPVSVKPQNSATWRGGVWISKSPLFSHYSVTYNDNNLGVTCNSANFSWIGTSAGNADSPNAIIENQWHFGGWDCIQPPGTNGWTVRDCYATYGFDDCIEDDSGGGGTVSDCLFDGVMQNWSSTGGVDHTTFTFINHLVRGWPIMHKGQYANEYHLTHNFPHKVNWDVGVDVATWNGCTLAFMAGCSYAYGNDKTYWDNLVAHQGASANNTILWINAMEPPPWMVDNLDPAWTLLTGVAARNDWITKRDAWLTAHNWNATLAEYRDEHRVYHGLTPGRHMAIPVGFTDGELAGTHSLFDKGADLDDDALTRGFSVGLKVDPTGSNMSGTVLSMGHVTIKVAGSVWTFTAGGRSIQVTQAYAAGTPVIVKAKASPFGLLTLKIDDTKTIEPPRGANGWGDESAFFFSSRVEDYTTGGIPISHFRLAPSSVWEWEWDLWAI